MKKKEQYSSFLLNAPISFAILSPDYTFLEVNSSLRKKLGNYAAKYYQGKTVESVFGKKCAQTMHTYIQRAFNGETIQNVSPLKYAPKNKGEYYFSLSYVPITLKRTVESVGIIFRDITEQKSAEEGLEKYKVRLEQAQKAGKLGVFEWDIKTNKIWWSDEEESLFGAYPGKFKGVFKDWIQSVYKPDKERLLTEIAHSLKTGTSLDQEFRIKYPGNIIRWLKVKAQVYKANGAATRMIGIHHDITGRKQHEDLLAFKAEASRVLSSTLDYKETLSKMSQLAVTHIADWCAVDMVDDLTNEIVLVSVAHRNTAKAKWARKLRKKYPVDMNANEGLPIVLKTGQSLLVPHLSRTQLEKNIKTDEEKAILKKIGGVHSFMIVPINIGSKTIGAITFISSESKRQYTKQDIEMAEQLASRASMAIETRGCMKQ